MLSPDVIVGPTGTAAHIKSKAHDINSISNQSADIYTEPNEVMSYI